MPVVCARATSGNTRFHMALRCLFFTLRYDSHFWWQRKENGPSQGIADGMSRGRDMNVFSTIIAVICVCSQPSALHACRRAVAYSFGVPICEVDCHCTSDGLAIENLQTVPLVGLLQETVKDDRTIGVLARCGWAWT